MVWAIPWNAQYPALEPARMQAATERMQQKLRDLRCLKRLQCAALQYGVVRREPDFVWRG